MDSFAGKLDTLSSLVAAGNLRQQVISHNIANVNTPHYQRLVVDFEQQLLRELENDGNASPLQLQPTIRTESRHATRRDGNTVDMDQEIGDLNKNALLQQTYLQLLGLEMQMMRHAIDG